MKKTKKIAVVEDDPTVKEIYEIKLRSNNYEVVSADNGLQAVKMIIKEKPDLVLLDILLPKMDGFDVIDKLKKSEDVKIRKVPVFIVSNLSSKEDIEEAKYLGVEDYIVKARSNPNDIIKKIKDFFDHE
ncbi:response regulator [Patescibacteria group bacterium]|nr:response regulator [Patescibacteria group bacterium]